MAVRKKPPVVETDPLVEVYNIVNDWISSHDHSRTLDGVITSLEIQQHDGASAVDLLKRGAIEYRGRYPASEVERLRNDERQRVAERTA